MHSGGSFRSTSPLRRRGSAGGASSHALHHPDALPCYPEDTGRGGAPVASISVPFATATAPLHYAAGVGGVQTPTTSPKRAIPRHTTPPLRPHTPPAHAAAAALSAPASELLPQAIHTFTADVRCICRVARRVVWVAERTGAIRVRDALSGAEIPPPQARGGAAAAATTPEVFKRSGLLVTCMLYVDASGSEGPSVWAGFNDGLIRVFCASTRALIREVGRHNGGVFSLCEAFGTVFSSGGDWKVVQWCTGSFRHLAQITSPSSSSVKCMVSGEAGCQVLITGAHDGAIRVYSQPDPRCCFDLLGHTAAVVGMELLNGMLWTASEDRTVRLWDLRSKRCVRAVNEHPPYRITSDIVALGVSNLSDIHVTLKDGSTVSIARDTCSVTCIGAAPLPAEPGTASSSRATGCTPSMHFAGDITWLCTSDGRVHVRGHAAASMPIAELAAARQTAAERLGEVVVLQEQVEALQRGLRTAATQAQSKDLESFQHAERSVELQGELAKLRSSDAENAALAGSSGERVARLEEENRTLLQRIAQLCGTNEGLERDLERLRLTQEEESKQSLEEKRRFLQGCEQDCRAEFETRIESLSRQLTAVATENEALRQQCGARETRVMELEENLRNALSDTTELSSLRVANKEAVSAIGSLEAQIAALAEALTGAKEANRLLEADLQQARTDRDMLSTEVRRLGELLAEVSQKAKEYQTANVGEMQQLRDTLGSERDELRKRLMDLQERHGVESSEMDALRQAIAERDARIEELKRQLQQQPELLDALKAQHEAELQRLRDELDALREQHRLECERLEAAARSGGGSAPSSRQQRLSKALGDTQNTLHDLEKLGGGQDGDPMSSEDLQAQNRDLEKQLADKEDEIKKLEAELEQLKGDNPAMGLYTQLQHEQVVKSELQRNNENLCDTIEQLKERILVLSSANRTLQDDNDRLLSDNASQADVPHGGVNFAPMHDGQRGGGPSTAPRIPTNMSTSNPRCMSELEPDILQSKTVPSELGGGSALASGLFQGIPSHHPGSKVSQGLPADRMNSELDSIVSYLDNMKHKLDSLETAAEDARDPYLREALLQEINSLHRQVLDDTLCHKARGGALGHPGSSTAGRIPVPEKRAMDLPGPIAGGILKMASEKFGEVERAIGLVDAQSIDAARLDSASISPPSPGHSPGRPRGSGGGGGADPAGGEGGGGGGAGDPTHFPSYNPNSMAGMVRGAYGFSADVNTGDLHPVS